MNLGLYIFHMKAGDTCIGFLYLAISSQVTYFHTGLVVRVRCLFRQIVYVVIDVAIACIDIRPHRGEHCEAMLICEVAFFVAQQFRRVQAVRISTIEVQPERNVAVCHYLFRNKSHI